MSEREPWRTLLEAGVSFVQLTQSKAEELLAALSRTGEVRAEEVQQAAADLVQRSREATEQLVARVRDEVMAQMAGLDVEARLAQLQDQLVVLRSFVERAPVPPATPAPVTRVAPRPAPKKAAPKKAAAKKAAAKKAAAKKAAAKKAAPKKAAPKKASS
jgi:polyhydroxyalkanoate synthesis regulator phasin